MSADGITRLFLYSELSQIRKKAGANDCCDIDIESEFFNLDLSIKKGGTIMKMKKVLALLMAMSMTASLAACGSKDTPADGSSVGSEAES